ELVACPELLQSSAVGLAKGGRGCSAAIAGTNFRNGCLFGTSMLINGRLGRQLSLVLSGIAKGRACWPKALRLDGSVRDPNALHMAVLEQVCQRAHDFDLLHFHLDYYPFSLCSRQSTPFVTTLHGRLDLPEHQVVFATFPSIPVISISDAQRRPVPRAGWVRTIDHGLPEQLLTPQPVRPTYFAFLGRVSPEKAVDQAIWIAKRCGIPLKIAAKVDAIDRDYFKSKIRKLLTPPDVDISARSATAKNRAFSAVPRPCSRRSPGPNLSD